MKFWHHRSINIYLVPSSMSRLWCEKLAGVKKSPGPIGAPVRFSTSSEPIKVLFDPFESPQPTWKIIYTVYGILKELTRGGKQMIKLIAQTEAINSLVLQKMNVKSETPKHESRTLNNRSLVGALRAPTSSWQPFGPALGPSVSDDRSKSFK